MRRPLILEFRLLFYAILGVIVPFGVLLYFFPGGTDSYWAWSIPEPRSAILIGAVSVFGSSGYCTASPVGGGGRPLRVVQRMTDHTSRFNPPRKEASVTETGCPSHPCPEPQ